MMELKKAKRAGWEYFTIIGVVVCSMVLSLALYAKRDQILKERLLLLELSTLRNYVAASILENRRRPLDLNNIPGPKVDPFGNPYRYNPKTGWVFSETPDYRHW